MSGKSNFSPVVIPTLCRYEHFKTCIDSLARCTHAGETDLFIALDYPLKESHWSGYRRINSYLETISGFKKVVVIRREENYGSAKNIKDALAPILTDYDSYIYLEDDNEVSPNFLEYMNKGLCKFKDDKSVFAICGYSFLEDVKHDANNFYRQNCGLAAWGCGIWKDRCRDYQRKLTRSYCIGKLLNPYTLLKAIHHSWSTFFFLVLKSINPELCTDNTYSLYMFFEKKDVIMPLVSKVRNHGFDGTGEHCGVNENFARITIDDKTSFDYEGSGYEHNAEINHKLRQGKREYMTFGKMLGHLYRMARHRIPGGAV